MVQKLRPSLRLCDFAPEVPHCLSLVSALLILEAFEEDCTSFIPLASITSAVHVFPDC